MSYLYFFYKRQASFFDIQLPQKVFHSLLSSEKKSHIPLCAPEKTLRVSCSAGSAWAMKKKFFFKFSFEKENRCNAIKQSSLSSLPVLRICKANKSRKSSQTPGVCFSLGDHRLGLSNYLGYRLGYLLPLNPYSCKISSPFLPKIGTRIKYVSKDITLTSCLPLF